MEESFEPQETNDINRIIPVNIEEQMKTAYCKGIRSQIGI